MPTRLRELLATLTERLSCVCAPHRGPGARLWIARIGALPYECSRPQRQGQAKDCRQDASGSACEDLRENDRPSGDIGKPPVRMPKVDSNAARRYAIAPALVLSKPEWPKYIDAINRANRRPDEPRLACNLAPSLATPPEPSWRSLQGLRPNESGPRPRIARKRPRSASPARI